MDRNLPVNAGDMNSIPGWEDPTTKQLSLCATTPEPGATAVEASVPRGQRSAAGETTARGDPRSTTRDSPPGRTGDGPLSTTESAPSPRRREPPHHDGENRLSTTADGALTTTAESPLSRTGAPPQHDRRDPSARPQTAPSPRLEKARQGSKDPAQPKQIHKRLLKRVKQNKNSLLRFKKAPGTIIHI